MLEKILDSMNAVLCVDNGSMNPDTGVNANYALVAPIEGATADSAEQERVVAWLSFQSGNPKEVGRNGFFYEEVMTAMLNRLSEHQKTEFACSENEEAIQHLNKAMEALGRRTMRVTPPTDTE